jgi:hypothetical protein
MDFGIDEIKELEKLFDERYVLQNDCNEVQSSVNKRFANDDKRIEILIQQQKINNWLTLAIAGGIISLVIKIFLGG